MMGIEHMAKVASDQSRDSFHQRMSYRPYALRVMRWAMLICFASGLMAGMTIMRLILG